MSIILPTEWDIVEELRVAREEGWEKGFEEGFEEGREERRKANEKRFADIFAQADSLDDLKKMFEALYSCNDDTTLKER